MKAALANVEAMLDATPPGIADTEARKKVLLALDEVIWSPDVVNDPDFRDFYRRRVDKGLTTIEQPPPESGARITKFYSSSVVVQTRDSTFAFDFCEGPSRAPIPAEQDPQPEYRDFRLADSQRDRLATALDAYFISHFHEDHLSCALAERMIAQGKPVVLPAQGKRMWTERGASFADGLRSANPRAINELGNISFCFYCGTQYMEFHDEAQLQPIFQSPQHRENNCYLVRVSGMTFTHCGENRDANVAAWADACKAEGWFPDVIFALGMCYARDQLASLWTGANTSIATHEYEYTHRPPNRYSRWLSEEAPRKVPCGYPCTLVFWGEHLDVPAPSMELRCG